MKKLFYAVLLLVGVGFMFSSCSKEGGNSRKLIGTWDCISTYYEYESGETENEGNVGNYVVITDKTITFYYGESVETSDNGSEYQYTYDGSVLFVAGIALAKITKLTSDTMVWESTTPAQSFSPFQRSTYKKRK